MCKKEQANTGDGEIWLNATFLRPQRFNIDELEHHVIIRSRYRKMIMEDTNMKKTIFAEKAPAAVGPYVHAVEAGNMVFTSGQLGLTGERNSAGRYRGTDASSTEKPGSCSGSSRRWI